MRNFSKGMLHAINVTRGSAVGSMFAVTVIQLETALVLFAFLIGPFVVS